jgi:hypothetical protein
MEEERAYVQGELGLRGRPDLLPRGWHRDTNRADGALDAEEEGEEEEKEEEGNEYDGTTARFCTGTSCLLL